jgi:hypothetical protein
MRQSIGHDFDFGTPWVIEDDCFVAESETYNLNTMAFLSCSATDDEPSIS